MVTLFLRNILKILILLLTIIVIDWMINLYIYHKSSQFFNLDKRINTLVLGDSHTKYAINDKLLRNTANFSNDADSYFYSYLKLKELKNRNPQIKNLILSFSYHNIDRNIEDLWLFNDSHLKDRLMRYYPLLDYEDYAFILVNKPIDLFTNLFTYALFPYKIWSLGKECYGGYKDLEHNILKMAIVKQKEDHIDTYQEAENEKYFLLKIKEYCYKNNIDLILINPPVHKKYMFQPNIVNNFHKKYLPNVQFLDFSMLDLKDDYFGDLVHLSSSGSHYFTKKMNELGLLH